MKLNEPENQNSWQHMQKHGKLHSDLLQTPGLEGGTFDCSRVSAEKTLISASAAPYREVFSLKS